MTECFVLSLSGHWRPVWGVSLSTGWGGLSVSEINKPIILKWRREMVSWLAWRFVLACLKCASSANTWTWCCCGSWSSPIMHQPQAPGPVTLMDVWLALTGFSLPMTGTDVTERSVSCSHLARIWKKTKALLYNPLSSWQVVSLLYLFHSSFRGFFFFKYNYNLIAFLKFPDVSMFRNMYSLFRVFHGSEMPFLDIRLMQKKIPSLNSVHAVKLIIITVCFLIIVIKDWKQLLINKCEF